MTQDAHGTSDLHRLRQQDPEAFRRLVDEHQQLVLALGQSMGLSGADLEDAAADVFAAVYRALPGFQGQSQVGTWVYRIAVRTIGKVRARRPLHQPIALQHEPCDPRSRPPEQRSLDAEANQRIWAAVARLDNRQAAVIEMHYRLGWPVERIAETLGAPAGSIKTLLFRARERLRELLKNMETPT